MATQVKQRRRKTKPGTYGGAKVPPILDHRARLRVWDSSTKEWVEIILDGKLQDKIIHALMTEKYQNMVGEMKDHPIHTKAGNGVQAGISDDGGALLHGSENMNRTRDEKIKADETSVLCGFAWSLRDLNISSTANVLAITSVLGRLDNTAAIEEPKIPDVIPTSLFNSIADQIEVARNTNMVLIEILARIKRFI